ncbi:hypothetical protein GGR58DRAFT_385 [Xylaria digitata]|nr:hypothetical protein GGR58DRAFT_385 [Xylaria digitata]
MPCVRSAFDSGICESLLIFILCVTLTIGTLGWDIHNLTMPTIDRRGDLFLIALIFSPSSQSIIGYTWPRALDG